MWTAEQEAQLQYLNSVLSGVQSATVAPPVPQPSLWNRAGHQAANLPSSIGQGFVNSLTGVSNALQTDEEQVTPYQVPRPYDIPQAQTTGQRLVDTGANLTSGLAQFALTAAALGPFGRLAGLQGAAARVATDAAVGAIQGIGTSPQEAGISAAQFGGMGAVNALPLPWYVRGAMNAALGAGGQVARGQPLNSLDSATQMAVPFIGTAAHAYFSGRGQQESQQPAPEVQQPMFAPTTVPQGQGVPIETPSIPDFSHLAPPEPAPRGPTVFSGPITSERAASGEGPLPILSPDTAPPTVPQGQGVSIGQPEIPDYSHLMPAPPEPKPPVRFSGPITQEPASIFGKSPAESIASNLGVTYNGFGEGLHAFTDPQTGSTFHVQSDLLTPELVAGKLQAIRAPFEQPGNILFGSSTDADIDAAIEAAKEPVPQASAPEPLQTFASTVNDLAKSAPFEDRFSGSPKVYIDRIWNKLPPGLSDSREDFNQKLFQANQKGLIQLSRLDLVGAEPRKDLIDRSEIKDRIGEYHLVNEPQAPRPILRPYSDPAKAQALLNEARAQRVPDNQAESLLQDRVAEARATQEVPTSLQKLAAMGRVSEEDLMTELGHYDDDVERSAIQGALGSTDSEPETLAADLKEKYGPKGGQRGSSYESNPSKGRSDEIDLMRADPTEPETGPKAMRRLTGEAGFLDIRSPALQYLAGTAAGALLKPILNRNRDNTVGEDMAEGAILGAGSVALARGVGGLLRASKASGGIKPILSDAKADAKETAKNLFTKEGQQKVAAGQAKAAPTVSGAIVDNFRKWTGMDITAEHRLDLERGLGMQTHLTEEAIGATGAFRALNRDSTPEEKAAASKFNPSPGSQADINALDNTPNIDPKFRDMLKVMKQVQIEAQEVHAKAQLPARQSLIESTMGTYQARVYRFFQDPVAWAKEWKAGNLDQAFSAVTDLLASREEFQGMRRDTIEDNLRQYLTDAQKGKPEQPGGKINAALFMTKKDLTPDQWKLMQDLRGDQRLSMQDRDIIKGMVTDGSIDGPGRTALKQIAGSGQLDDATNKSLKTIADTDTVQKAWRDLFGEVTDPVEKQALTIQKLLGTSHIAATISNLHDSVLPDGRKMAYSMKELDAARTAAEKAGNTKLFNALSTNYSKLDSSLGYGKLSGMMLDRGAHQVLNSFQSGTEGSIYKFFAKIQTLLKLDSTVLNPATHAHWWMQMPLMMAMGRVYNPAMMLRAAQIAFGNVDAKLREELVRNGIMGSDMSTRELSLTNKKFSPQPMPDTTIEKMKDSGDKAISFLGKMYGKPDNIIRIATYLTQKEKVLEEAAAAAQGRGLTGPAADAFAEQYAQDNATKFTNRYTINYGATPPVTQKLRNIPGFNPFLSYTSEMLRITKNFAEDIATGPASDKMHAAANLGLMAGVPLALSLGSKQANLSQEDQDLWDRVQRLEPTYLRHSIKLVLGRDSRGAFNYVDMAPVLPSGDFYSLAKEAATGDWKTFMSEQPLWGLDSSPLASLAMDISRGENHITGQKIYTPGDYAALIWNAGTPPVIGTQLSRDIRAATPNQDGGWGIENPRTGRTDTPGTSLLQHAGVRIASETFPAMLGNLQSDRQDKLDAAKSQMLQILRTNAGPDARQDAVNVFRNRAQEVNQSFLQKVQGS